ncbi:tetratricopeptide repeat protein [Blastopirellula retiformator]|uniref:Tetratricopeptide repeat protein n=1 Tax=Blastopirellula retiformator TaxID=2527970 RepID=A0A5C5UWL7_9BACT|nr:tetratricopeptide repeat protein [Blastopirellula retiformator]TWT30568.1 Tetratricopeptide repeat protein [Blastopirellula retiformator]
MPIQIQCTAVVIRNDALERVLEDGAAGFAAIAPNAMSYGDEKLSQASFMAPVDAEEFAKLLELHGLDRSGDSPDFVIVQTRNQAVEPECDWLFLFEYEGRLIATLRGWDSRKVIAPADDSPFNPDAIQHYSDEEIAEKFEFVERKDGIDTYREKATGKLVYQARQSETPDEIFARAFETVWQLRREPGMPAKTGDEAAQVEDAIDELQPLAAKYPDAANVALALGMAWYTIGKEEKGQRQLVRAVELEPENTILHKELGAICLARKDYPVALDTAIKAVAVKPDDAELLGNLAVIQMLSGSVDQAEATIEHAVRLSPEDVVNRNVQGIIADVVSGNRKRPETLEEMMAPPE